MEKVSFIVEMIDKASDGLKDVGKKVDDFSSRASKNFQTAGLAFAGFGATMAGVATVAMKSWIDESLQGERALAQLNAGIASTKGVAGLTVDALESQAEAMSKLNAVDDEAIMTGQAMLLTFTGIGKDIFPGVTQAGIDMATKFNGGVLPSAEQLNSTMNMLGKAFNDPVDGMNRLTKQGVVLSEEQQNLIKSLAESGDTMGAQKVLLDELMTEYGGSAAAAAQTLEGRQAALNIAWGNAKQALGDQLRPALTGVYDEATKLIEAFNGLPEPMIQMIAYDTAIAGAIGLLMVPLGGLLIALPSLATGFEVAAGILSAVFAPEVLAVVAAVTIAFGGLIAGLYSIYQIWTTNIWGIRDAVIEVWGVLQTQFQRVWQEWAPLFNEAWNAMSSIVAQAISSIKGYLDANMPGWKDKFVEAAKVWIPAIADAIIKFKDTMLNWINETLPKVQEWVNYIREKFEIFKNVYLPIIIEAWEIINKKVIDTIDELKPYIELGLNYIQDLWKNHIESNKSYLMAAWDIIKGLFQGWFGQLQVVAGIGLGLLTGDWTKAWEIMKAGFQNQWEGVKSIAEGIWGTIVNIFETQKNNMISNFENGIATVKQEWNDLVGWIANNPIVQTITKVTNWITGTQSAMGNVFNGGMLMPFADGGIVARPTLFPMANGVGLMGEAGPEAIMPLRRNSSGQLGVVSSGRNGINVSISGNNFYGNDKEFAQKIGDTIIKKFSNTYSFNGF